MDKSQSFRGALRTGFGSKPVDPLRINFHAAKWKFDFQTIDFLCRNGIDNQRFGSMNFRKCCGDDGKRGCSGALGSGDSLETEESHGLERVDCRLSIGRNDNLNVRFRNG